MPYYPATVRVARVEQLSPHLLRIAFHGGDLARLGWDGPDQRIKLVLPLPDGRLPRLPEGDEWYARWRALPDADRPPMRTYTIRGADPAARELVVDFVVHGDEGPASRWAVRARAGDELVALVPDATGGDAGGWEWRPGGADTLLLAGDETALPAIAAILESLPGDATAAVLVEVPSAADELPLVRPAGVTLDWLPRDGRAYGARLETAVREWADGALRSGGASDEPEPFDADDVLWEVPATPDGPGLFAWLAGEAGAITRIRRHLVKDLGVDRSRVAFMGYWKLGRAES